MCMSMHVGLHVHSLFLHSLPQYRHELFIFRCLESCQLCTPCPRGSLLGFRYAVDTSTECTLGRAFLVTHLVVRNHHALRQHSGQHGYNTQHVHTTNTHVRSHAHTHTRARSCVCAHAHAHAHAHIYAHAYACVCIHRAHAYSYICIMLMHMHMAHLSSACDSCHMLVRIDRAQALPWDHVVVMLMSAADACVHVCHVARLRSCQQHVSLVSRGEMDEIVRIS